MNKRTNVVPKEMEVIKQRFHYNPGVMTCAGFTVCEQVLAIHRWGQVTQGVERAFLVVTRPLLAIELAANNV